MQMHSVPDATQMSASIAKEMTSSYRSQDPQSSPVSFCNCGRRDSNHSRAHILLTSRLRMLDGQHSSLNGILRLRLMSYRLSSLNDDSLQHGPASGL